MEENKINKTKNTSTVAGLVFTGCMFIGMGLGFYFNEIVIGLFIGMGTGFIAMGIIYALMKQGKS